VELNYNMNINNFPKDVLSIIKPPFWYTYHYVCIALANSYKNIFKKYLNDKSGLELLDYGCGVTPYKSMVHNNCSKYIGVDVGYNPKADIIISPGQSLPFNNEIFDIVLSSQVLEHVEDVPQYMKECNRVLKKHGLLIISTHGTWQYHSAPIDVQRWTSYGLKYLIEKYNFEILEFVPVLGQLALTSQLRLTFFDSFAKLIGPIGKIFLYPISAIYQLKMRFEDIITPQRVKERDSAIFLLVAKKLNNIK